MKSKNLQLSEKIRQAFEPYKQLKTHNRYKLNTARCTYKAKDINSALSDGFSQGEKTHEDLTSLETPYNFLDQLEYTEKSYLNSSEPEKYFSISENTDNYSKFVCDEEGLGEPEEELEIQK